MKMLTLFLLMSAIVMMSYITPRTRVVEPGAAD
jgi:hypothetical protein